MADQITYNKQVCFNCETPLPNEETYCPNCGQKNTDGKPSLKELVSEFFSNIFSLDSSLFRTLRDIFIPAKLTNQYFSGKRKSYTPPLRIFFVSAIIMFALILRTGTELIDINVNAKNIVQSGIHLNPADVDSLETSWTEKHLNQMMDSTILDSMLNEIRVAQGMNNMNGYMSLGVMKNSKGENVKIPFEDLKATDAETLIEKYEIQGYWGKSFLVQVKRFFDRPITYIRFVLSNMVWMLILLMPALALVMKLIYIRRKRYFVEHLVFLLHFHSLIYLLVSMGLLVSFYDSELGAFFMVGVFIVGHIFEYLALKFYYKQGWIKTFFKLLLINLFYTFIFVIFIGFMGLLSFLIF